MSTPKEVHTLEQAFASVATLAVAAARYYLALLEEGIDPQVALFLTVEYQKVLANPQRNPDQ